MRCVATLLLILLATAPASAQIVGRPDYGTVRPPDPFVRDARLPSPPIGRDLHGLRERIGRGRDSGSLSRREARRLDREARVVSRLARRYARDGLSDSERAELDRRSQLLRSSIARAQTGSTPSRGRR